MGRGVKDVLTRGVTAGILFFILSHSAGVLSPILSKYVPLSVIGLLADAKKMAGTGLVFGGVLGYAGVGTSRGAISHTIGSAIIMGMAGFIAATVLSIVKVTYIPAGIQAIMTDIKTMAYIGAFFGSAASIIMLLEGGQEESPEPVSRQDY